MARAKKLTYGAVNITMHPHSPEKYIELFRMARKNASNVNLRGDSFATLSYFYPYKKGQAHSEPFEGEVLKYTDIDVDGDWFDIVKKDIASDEEKGRINIPDNLKPNVARFSFVFLPVSHLLVYEMQDKNRHLTSRQMESFLNGIFSHEKIIEKFGKVNVTALTEPDSVERMLSLKGITCINMVTRRPNPDDLASAESIMQKRFKRIGVIEEDKTYKSERGQEIKPDGELKQDALIASRNGEVSVRRINEVGLVEVHASSDVPLQRVESYDSDVTSVSELLLLRAKSLAGEFKRLLRR
ncbi:DUF4747 family protein [Serratia marcescens]|uniref:DUF4747 family protein n=1 Tax=Serratia TaxID=613 RepID=UPI00177446EC|nr:DUF4747 family protein [Serratia marcescens]MCK1087730.1 DUF4747 family protein [Serratia marcescens]MCT4802379.1 DUF4747 family protein [Serratia marcescens]QLJ23673.1 DUF4747 family protein [Serratia marcescens]QLJ27853.1 DUF4747 family protein [Serratia marcescens]QLJ32588.1 DUF4747 family protein [Serratia marcescens]